ncbi:uncharacterized protein GIQ15_03605 [Arthroderma uncinatum]|uniref:uncharacterized protein n=1 Tax=Arthroderma uncinatum TaxID=74035 RepID=UPI00144AC0AA|nr:uncharacterized protein GIQ15_03605 [Arthroderma uncinatum]KAF3484281.1 hypothetical protein GIQ15_03605 [Arthroderma uncinatum]
MEDTDQTETTRQPTLSDSSSETEASKPNWDNRISRYKVVEFFEEQKDSELEQYIFIVRVRVDKVSKEPTTYVDIKSKFLCGIVYDIMKGANVPLNLRENKPTVEQNLLYLFLSELVEAQRAVHVEEHGRHLAILVAHVEGAYASISKRLAPLLSIGEITYDLLWAIFKPGSFVYGTCSGTEKPRCVVFDTAQNEEYNGLEYFCLVTHYLDFDGKEFGLATIRLRIPRFTGLRLIRSLPAFPLAYHPRKDNVRQSLLECGRKFYQLAGIHTRQYHGRAFFVENGEIVKVNVNGRVVIDAAFFQSMNPNYPRPWIDVRDSYTLANNGARDTDSNLVRLGQCQNENLKQSDVRLSNIKDDALLTSCPTVLGFSLNDKRFLEFAVANIGEVTWASNPFKCLAIPAENKDLLTSLAMKQLGIVCSLPFDDVVRVVSGPPGVGKTLTAEALSEHLHRPLYSISAGELIAEPGRLEATLKLILKIAKHCGAILLLDEADVFLERRSHFNDHHNRLVAVFLRALEYSEGILFLTTNRVTEFDDAILNRVHLKLRYDGLSREQRKHVWKYFISKANTHQGPADITAAELNSLETLDLNGREPD